MAVVQFRGLSASGVQHDPSPYELPLTAWSGGMNMRFHANRAERAPAFKTLHAPSTAPAYAFANRAASGSDRIFYADTTGDVKRYVPSGDYSVLPSGFQKYAVGQAFNSCTMGDVTYINSPSGQPLYWGPTSTEFSLLPGWDSTWSCRVLRIFGDYVLALNVTKGGNAVPQMVKWSDLTLIGEAPNSWDADDQTTNAGENPLEGLTSPIVDGCPMREAFIIYASDQAWEMQQTGSQEIFQFNRLGIDGGLIAPNCVVEVNGIHYCFGLNDLYCHDSLTQKSLCDGLNRDYIFSTLDMTKRESFFTIYSAEQKEILFCYATTDSTAAFTSVTGCNRAAVFSLAANTWSFLDLPNVTSGMVVTATLGTEWADLADESPEPVFSTYTPTYQDLTAQHSDDVVFASQMAGSLTQSRFLVYDFINRGDFPNLTAEAECNADAILERVGLDLDTLGSDLTTYKKVRRVFPQTQMYENVPIQIYVGGSNYPSGPVIWNDPVSFNPVTQYKVDMRAGGRYLAFKMQVDSLVDFSVVGFDADVVSAGRR